jgi:hypothetical protein
MQKDTQPSQTCFMENPLIAGFAEIQHEAKTWASSRKTIEGQASLYDCHKTARLTSNVDFLLKTNQSCLMFQVGVEDPLMALI